ncbi:MAG: hypothetical protein A2W31_12235 [Planctomycetes bacterium RBG_16_64_10]|nr:MAG: hypothetical protein A2W31_12235 [Planctomycetes bacterium RBG_16_64_10]
MAQQLQAAATLKVEIQPCLRDIWNNHVLFVGPRVSGIVDFGAMRYDNVAADISRLLASMAGSDQAAWHTGLAAYQSVRPLSEAEQSLVAAFDRSSLLMAGLQWVDWIYDAHRLFDDQQAILARVDRLLMRLEQL